MRFKCFFWLFDSFIVFGESYIQGHENCALPIEVLILAMDVIVNLFGVEILITLVETFSMAQDTKIEILAMFNHGN